MTRTVAALLFVASAALVASVRPGTSQTVVPQYGVVQTQQFPMSKADVATMIELLKEIAANTAKPQAAKAKGPDMLAVARAKCAGCHTPAKAEEKGGGFILLVGEGPALALKPLSVRERTAVERRVEDGDMPPSGKLSPAERSAFHK